MSERLRRQDDITIAVLGQEFRDFIEQYHKDQERAEKWRNVFEIRMIDLESFMSMAKRPYRLALYLLGGIALTACATFWHVIWKEAKRILMP